MGELQRLIEAVEAGADWISVPASKALPPQQAVLACRAYGHEGQPGTPGSLDAAKALHDALLPADECVAIDMILRPGGNVEWRCIIHQQGLYDPHFPLRVIVECGHHVSWNNPARAWLLAILRALAKREQG